MGLFWMQVDFAETSGRQSNVVLSDIDSCPAPNEESWQLGTWFHFCQVIVPIGFLSWPHYLIVLIGMSFKFSNTVFGMWLLHYCSVWWPLASSSEFHEGRAFVYFYCRISKNHEDVWYVEDTHKYLLNDLVEFQK